MNKDNDTVNTLDVLDQISINNAAVAVENAMDGIGKRGGRLEQFIDKVLSGVPVKIAYEQSGYSIGSLPNAYKILNKPKIKELIKAKCEQKQLLLNYVSREFIANTILEIMLNNKSDSLRLKACVELSKLLGYSKEQVDVKYMNNEPLFTIMQMEDEPKSPVENFPQGTDDTAKEPTEPSKPIKINDSQAVLEALNMNEGLEIGNDDDAVEQALKELNKTKSKPRDNSSGVYVF